MTPEAAIEHAVELARHAPASGPNPRVGAVLLRGDQIIGEGWHKGAGHAHAESAALQDAIAKGNEVEGATLVVTLEPCKHHGRTPPCTNLIEDAGISEVIYACSDPGDTPGSGSKILAQKGIKVHQLENENATELIRVWSTAIKKGRPYVTAKIAASLDGRIAAADGSSQWITCPASRDHSHQVRSEVDAIAVTTGTVLKDNPALTARTQNGDLMSQQPLRVVVGERTIGPDAKIWHTGFPDDVVHYRTHDITEVLEQLAEREVRHVLLEGGPALLTEAFRAGVVDEVHAYIAPVVIGSGPNAVQDYGAETLGQALRFKTISVQRLGEDALLIARND